MKLSEKVLSMKEELVEIRRDIHKYPEPGWEEYRTSSIIADYLEKCGIEVIVGEDVCKKEARMGVPDSEYLKNCEKRALEEGAKEKWVNRMKGGQTGVIGLIKGEKSGPIIACRFDIDSIELQESLDENHTPVKEGFVSCHPGVFHGCGHDGHAAIGLGLARLLSENRDKIQGEIRLIFQPAEEGLRGSKSIIEAGWLKEVNYYFASHIWPSNIEPMNLGENERGIIAAVDGFLCYTGFRAKFQGKSSHAGMPELGRNALLAAASFALHAHSISRTSEGGTRINVGILNAGKGINVVPDEAEIKFETRGDNIKSNEMMKTEAIRMVKASAEMYGCTVEYEIIGDSQRGECSKELISYIMEAAGEMGIQNVIPNVFVDQGSEDAMFMVNEVRKNGGYAAFMGVLVPLAALGHQRKFDFNEDAIVMGPELYYRIINKVYEKIDNK